MARYSSDSDDDRRRKEKRSKSSRKRIKRSRSRSKDRGRKSSSYSKSSRSHRRRSKSSERRSRESSYDSYRSSSRRSRSNRVSRSRSRSSSRSSEDRHREKRTQDVTKEQTKERIKEALSAVENKDDDLLKSKEKKKLGKEVIPSMSAIAQIESNEFVQQSFTSSSTNKHETSQTDKGPEDGIFSGTRIPSLDTSKILNTILADNEGLFAPALLEDEDTKMERWIRKLTSKRNELLAASFN